jgi:four helix bundle protein
MDKKINSFEDLIVWQKSIELVKLIYFLTATGGFFKDLSFREQIRRASVSISTNIAGGFERFSRKEYIHFLVIAKGSAGEVRSLLRIAFDLGYLEASQYDQARSSVLEVSRFLSNQIQSLKRIEK